MKRTVLPIFTLLALVANGQTVLLQENFDSYAAGSGMVDNDPTHWAVWPGGGDQAVSTSFAQSGTNSLACISDNASNGGPGDLLLLLGDKTSGVYDLSWSMYIPADKGGYFNVQHAEDVGSSGSFGLEAIFENGTVTATAANADVTGTYVPGEWTDILINVDLDNATASLFVNGTSLTTWDYTQNTQGGAVTPQLGAIDFFSYGGGTALGEYYLDDISYVQNTGGIGFADLSGTDMRVFPNPATDVVNVTLASPLSPSAKVCLVDMTGKQVMNIGVLSTNALRFQLAELPSGVYFIRIEDGPRTNIARVTKR